MHGLEVRSYKVHVSPGHLKSGMSKRLLQMEDGAAAPEIVYRECMMECVERATWRGILLNCHFRTAASALPFQRVQLVQDVLQIVQLLAGFGQFSF